jgi:hypothetical protein
MKRTMMLTLVIMMIAFTGINWAVEEDVSSRNPVAEVMVGPNGINWNPSVQYSKLVLTVSRPDGQVVERTFAEGAIPGYDLGSDGLPVLDGSYTYELRVIPVLANKGPGRESGDVEQSGSPVSGPALTQSGGFYVHGGMIASPALQEGPTTSVAMGNEPARTMDIIHNDDVIITFSACIGNDCVNGENFGFDTLRLKENNLRIKFQDTSNSASFPSNDWQLTANSSSNGGLNYFAIDDIDNGKTPFLVEAGAPSNTLYVASEGRLGIRTSTPVVDIHVKQGNTPTLRLEQDGSSGFTPQTWDVAGNETNFFVRDATNGSKIPFKIKPSAPTNSLFVAANGDIGIGTQSPTERMHMLTDSSTNAKILLVKSSGATGQVTASSSNVQIGSASTHPVRIVTNGSQKMEITTDGSISMAVGNGSYDHNTGQWVDGSSREYKENIADLKTDAAMAAFEKLNPVTFKLKNAPKGTSQVGFIAEDVPELVAQESRKGLAPMDIVAVLTKVVQEQQKTIKELKSRLEKVEKKTDSK